jgi:hypothetical protein
MTRRASLVFLGIAWLQIFFLVGCTSGKKFFTLKGSVSYKGKPLSSGIVRLYMSENRVAMAMIHPDGSFEVTDVIPGEAKVTVEEDMLARQPKPLPMPGRKTVASTTESPSSSDPIPAKYKDVKTSGLIFTLVPGQPLNIDLQ